MRRKIFMLIVLNFGVVFLKAQRPAEMTNIPATPQTTALFKAIAAPVSYYTGQPDVSIPIYTISQDGVEVPISISFSTSGILVNEDATSIGLGVNLNWGGSIVRSPNGRPDERGFFYDEYKIGVFKEEIPKNYSVYTPPVPALCYPYCDNPSNLQILADRLVKYHAANAYSDPYNGERSGETGIDFRPDNFFYNFLGKSGSFKFNQADRKFVTFPLDDITIEKTISTSPSIAIQKFEILRNDGVKVVFGDGAVESTRMTTGLNLDQSWFIKQIVTLKNSIINFSYIDNTFQKATDRTYEKRIPYQNGWDSNPPTPDAFYGIEKLISTISFKEGRLEFSYVRDRTDMVLTTSGSQSARLSHILLYDNNNNLLKRFQFYQSYFVGYEPAQNSASNGPLNNNRLKLDSLNIFDNLSNRNERYSFEYYGAGNIPTKTTLGRDHWGYYNGADNNISLIPSSLESLDVNGGFRPFNYNWG